MEKANSNKQELLELLPDYISGRIEDKAVIKQIEDEITLNVSFREEYESLLKAYDEISGMKFSEPPEHYFTNLLPRINERLEQKTGKMKSFRLSYVFRYAIPAFSVILVILIITFSNKNGNEDLLHKIHDSVPQKSAESLNSDKTENLPKAEDTQITKSQLNEVNTENPELRIKKTSEPRLSVSNSESVENIIELISDTDEQEDADEDYFYDSDFNLLTKSEQAEILNKLENTNLK